MGWILHVHRSSYEGHLVSRVVDVGHDGSGHRGETVSSKGPGVIVLRSGDGRDPIRRCGRSIRRLLRW